jgi:ubiquinone/menaquinone biosynthesis C-methylase UbiE
LNSKDQISTKEDTRYFDDLYKGQMDWTASTRKRLYRHMDLFHAKRILEVGSGTGAILREIRTINPSAKLIGLDQNLLALKYSQKMATDGTLILGDGAVLPFSSQGFDIVVCHYFLMWVEDPIVTLREMLRVTRMGGWIACLAEPDYGGRLDFPDSEIWRDLLLNSISAADPFIGRKLRTFFYQIGLQAHVGLQSVVLPTSTVYHLYEAELVKLKRFGSPENQTKLKKLTQLFRSHKPEELFSFMPVFYALARRVE